LLGPIDDQDVDGAGAGLELQSKLLAQRGDERRAIGIDRRCRRRIRRSCRRRGIGCPRESEFEVTLQARLVLDRPPVADAGRQHTSREIADRHPAARLPWEALKAARRPPVLRRG